MKTEPQILRHPLDQALFATASVKFLVALAIVIALLSLCAAIAAAGRRRPTSAMGWLAGAAIVAAIVAAILVGSITATYAACAPRFAGLASYYSNGESGNRTASGARFDDRLATAAHRCLPFGTRLRVSRAGRTIIVIINDRGPAAWTGRVLDLARGPAAAIGLVGPGVGRVEAEVIQ
jgi:rare lipoprotein A (peptidoglycan hydrolase)